MRSARMKGTMRPLSKDPMTLKKNLFDLIKSVGMVRKTMESPEVTLTNSTVFKVENQSEEEMPPPPVTWSSRPLSILAHREKKN